MNSKEINCISTLAKIFPLAKIIAKTGNCKIGDYSQIDDFVFINCGQGVTIGKYVHISSFTSIIGGGRFFMEDFSGLSAGCRIITGTDDFSEGHLTNPTVPNQFRQVKTGSVVIKKHSIIGTNCVVMPDVIIGEGATIGAGSIINKNIDPWGIYVGYNPKKIGERDKQAVIDREKELLLLQTKE
jgi:galactoside O-acetyltransferase